MPCRARPAAVLLIFFGLCLCYAAGTQQASAQQATSPQATSQGRDCSGTLCDFYYGGSSDAPAAAKGDAPTQLTVPGGGLLRHMFGGDTSAQDQAGGQQVPTKRPLVGVGGGGLAGMARGEPAQRCTGTLCDFYYGGPSSETPAQSGQETAGSPAMQRATTEAASDAPASPGAPDPELPVYRAPPRCAATGRDPWACYRK